MSRYKSKKGRSSGRFVRLIHTILKSDAWKDCSPPARAVYVQIMLRYNGYNNGYIPLSCREASQECNISKNTANRAFKELVELKLIKCITPSNFNCRKKLACEWGFTHLTIDGRPATGEWKDYKKNPSPKKVNNSTIRDTNILYFTKKDKL